MCRKQNIAAKNVSGGLAFTQPGSPRVQQALGALASASN
jgi:hypothetical protein